ncbi:hypothetical protein LEN26_010745 [Aphanomyces euteiches]|nr:hypothetical protein AeMF1_011166 [Aphanomyces euteiches]KAH9121265.1 hypothetical protein LEN26_010745 [Aphanomyces euteiches]KAH9197197.1 hypothetical protein AeNC1_000847 [Aphanomyces euteiches]
MRLRFIDSPMIATRVFTTAHHRREQLALEFSFRCDIRDGVATVERIKSKEGQIFCEILSGSVDHFFKSGTGKMSASVQKLLEGISRGDERAVHAAQNMLPKMTPAQVEGVVANACLSGSYTIFERLVVHPWSAVVVPQLAKPEHKHLSHHFVNLAVQGANVDIINKMCRLTGLHIRDVVDRVPSSKNPAVVKVITPLLIAAVGGHIEVVHYLLEQGVNVNLGLTREGNSPLGMATIYGHAMVVEALTAAGANVYHQNAKGETIEDLATAYEQTDVLYSLPRGTGGIRPAHVHSFDETSVRRKIKSIRQSSSHTDYSLEELTGDVDLTPLQRRIALMKARVEVCRRNSLDRRNSSPTSSSDDGESF